MPALHTQLGQRILGAAIILITILAIAIGYNQNIATAWQKSYYSLSMRLDTAQGLQKGSNILLAGVKVGNIKSIRLNENDYSTSITLNINRKFKLPQDTSAVVRSNGIFGEKYIRLTPGGLIDNLQHNEHIHYVENPLDFKKLLQSIIARAEKNQPKNKPS